MSKNTRTNNSIDFSWLIKTNWYPKSPLHKLFIDCCRIFLVVEGHDLWRWSKSTLGGSQADGLSMRSRLTTMVSPTTPWFVWFPTLCKDGWIILQLFSRSTVVPSCLPLFFCTWSNQSWLFPRSLNMSTIFSQGSFSFGIMYDRVINYKSDLSKKGETTWQIGRSPHCAWLSDLSIPRRLAGGTIAQFWHRHNTCKKKIMPTQFCSQKIWRKSVDQNIC